MKALYPLAAPALFLSVPAAATSGAFCTAPDAPGLKLDLVIGIAPGPVVSGARVSDGGHDLEVGEGKDLRVLQGWIDEDELKLDLADAEVTRYVARLRVEKKKGAGSYTGTLFFNGRTYRAVCTLDV